MKLNQNIETTGTNSITSYGDAKTFVENLANHLKVQTQLPSNLKMISVGTNAPGSEYQDVPWLELDANNNPKFLKFYNGSSWEPIVSDLSIKNQVGGFQIQQGIATMTISDSTGSTADVEGQRIMFPVTFASDAIPIVTLTPMYCSVYEALSADGNENTSFDYWVTDVQADGFNVGYHVREIQNLLESVTVKANKETANAISTLTPTMTDVASTGHTHGTSNFTQTTVSVAKGAHTHDIGGKTTTSVAAPNHIHTTASTGVQTASFNASVDLDAGVSHQHDIPVIDVDQTSTASVSVMDDINTTTDNPSAGDIQSVVGTLNIPATTLAAQTSVDKTNVVEDLNIQPTDLTNFIKAENFGIETTVTVKESFKDNRPITGATVAKTFKFAYMAIGKAL